MSRGRLALQAGTGVAVGALCLWLAARRVRADELIDALAGFQFAWLVPAVGLSLLIQIMRAWRWRLELTPLARLRLGLTWQVVAVAYMAINILPFRLGEPVRPLLLSWKTGLRVPAIVGNWVFEKMMDAAAMVLFVHLTLLVTDLPSWAWRASAVSLTGFVALAALVAGVWLRGEAVFDRSLGRVLRGKAHAWTLEALRSAREGLSLIPDRRLVVKVFAATLVLWSLPILSSWVMILGFGFDLPIAAAFVVFVAIGAGTALPNPPGMFGVFQIACVVALGLFGVPKAEALAYGILLNAVQFVTLVAQGLVALPLVGVGVGRIARAAAGAERPS